MLFEHCLLRKQKATMESSKPSSQTLPHPAPDGDDGDDEENSGPLSEYALEALRQAEQIYSNKEVARAYASQQIVASMVPEDGVLHLLCVGPTFLLVSRFLTDTDLLQVDRTCRLLHSLCQSEDLWKVR